MKYAGIGSRKAPVPMLRLAYGIGRMYAIDGYTLRSGGAEGMDRAFERGVDFERGSKEIFTMNNGYDDWAWKVTERFHPAPYKLTRSGFLLHNRNAKIVLGNDGDDPVDFVICWTQDGGLKGGTAQALRIAQHYDIPIFNLCFKSVKQYYHGELKMRSITVEREDVS